MERIAAEPSYQQVLCRLLEFCTNPRTGREINAWMLPFPEMRIGLQSPGVLLRWMVEAGGIAQQGWDGEDDLWETTEAGWAALEKNDPVQRLRHLAAEEPQNIDTYRLILDFCQTPRSREEIEALVYREGNLSDPKVYPSYYIDRLEAAGGLEWTGRWVTTEPGRSL